MSTRQKSFFDQDHRPKHRYPPHHRNQFGRTRSANDAVPAKCTTTAKPSTQKTSISASGKTKRKLKAFQFIDGYPDPDKYGRDKENEPPVPEESVREPGIVGLVESQSPKTKVAEKKAVEQKPIAKQPRSPLRPANSRTPPGHMTKQLPEHSDRKLLSRSPLKPANSRISQDQTVKPAPTQSDRLPPSTPQTRLPLDELIGCSEQKSAQLLIDSQSPEEQISWQLDQQRHFRTTTPLNKRKRKRCHSSSPTSSQSDGVSNNPNLLPPLPAPEVANVKTPLHADPSAALWSRYAPPSQVNNLINDEVKAGDSISNLLRDSSPQSSATVGSVSGLRRWFSCGFEFPETTRKKRRTEPNNCDLEGLEEKGHATKKTAKGIRTSKRFTERIRAIRERETAERTLSQGEKGETEDDQGEKESPVLKSDGMDVDGVDQAHMETPCRDRDPPRSSPDEKNQTSNYSDEALDIDPEEWAVVEQQIRATQEEKPSVNSAPREEPFCSNNVIAASEVEQSEENRDGKGSEFEQYCSDDEYDDFGNEEDDEMLMEAVNKFESQHLDSTKAPNDRSIVADVLDTEQPKTIKTEVPDEFSDEYGDEFDEEQLQIIEAVATQTFQQGSMPNSTPQKPHEGAIQRFLVKSVRQSTYLDSRGIRQDEKIITLEEDGPHTIKTVSLRQLWRDTKCTVGMYVNIIGPFSKSGNCIIDNSENMIIVHPDALISATSVADAFNCMRKAVLQHRVKATNDKNSAMFYGKVLHEVFQECLVQNMWTPSGMNKILNDVLPRHFETMAELSVSLKTAEDTLLPKLQEIRTWGKKYSAKEPQRGAILKGRNDKEYAMSITKPLEVEEHVWSPRFGLKGNIDATVQISVQEGPESRTLTVPFELKTGKNVRQEHQAQTTLYTLLVTDRYDISVRDGILYYSEDSNTIRIETSRMDLIHLIMKRNELAGYVQDKSTIPPVLETNYQRQCGGCYAQTTCYLYHKLGEGDETAISDQNKQRFEKLIQNLGQEDQDFFQKWDRLLTKEESEMTKLKKELWTMLSKDRERIGRCFSDVIIDPGVHSSPKKSALLQSTKFRYTFAKRSPVPGFSFAESQITVGEPVVISDERGHYNLANGFVSRVSKRKITVSIDRRLRNTRVRGSGFDEIRNQTFSSMFEPHSCAAENTEPMVYRIDKDEFSNGMAIVRNNLLQIMDDNLPRSASLRSLIIHNNPPTFNPPPADWKPSPPWQAEMNPGQQTALEKVIDARDYALILGMPGTGKTTTVAHIIRSLVADGKSVLLTSYTHTAVDNILLKIRACGFDILRLGNPAKIHPEVRRFAKLGTPGTPFSSPEEVRATWLRPRVVATTCLGINHPVFTQRSFDVCIVDEASQITLPVCLGPIQLASRFVLVGDHFQLPPLVQNKEAAEGGLDVSLFRLLSEHQGSAVVCLAEQYRMAEEVMMLANRLVYNGQLVCGSRDVAERMLRIPDPDALRRRHCEAAATLQLGASPPFHSTPTKSPRKCTTPRPRLCMTPTPQTCPFARALDPSTRVLFINTSPLVGSNGNNTKLETLRGGNRLANPTEAAIITMLTSAFLDAGVPAQDIGLVTFYRSQLAYLKGVLKSELNRGAIGQSSLAMGSSPCAASSDGAGAGGGIGVSGDTAGSAGSATTPAAFDALELHTADKFQGRDKEAILVSFVRSNPEGEIGELLRDWRRVNVAVTRARCKLVLVGCKRTLVQGGGVVKGLVEMCEEMGWVWDLSGEEWRGHGGLTLGEGEENGVSKGEKEGKENCYGNRGGGKGNSPGVVKGGRTVQRVVGSRRPVLRDIVNEIDGAGGE